VFRENTHLKNVKGGKIGNVSTCLGSCKILSFLFLFVNLKNKTRLIKLDQKWILDYFQNNRDFVF